MHTKLPQLPNLGDSIATVKGFGPKRVEALHRAKIFTLQDALLTYPSRYEDRSVITPIAACVAGEAVCVRAVIGTQPTFHRLRAGMEMSKLRVFDESGSMEVTYFHNRYAAQALQLGHEYLLYGVVKQVGKQWTMTNPTAQLAPAEGEGGGITPIYPLVNGVHQADMYKLTTAAVACVKGDLPDPIPQVLCEKYEFPILYDAIDTIHRPQSMQDLADARRRMLFEDIFVMCCALQQLRGLRQQEQGLLFLEGDIATYCNQLAFTPTQAQSRVMEEILHDLRSGQLMNRMVQGDVGSGKTVVAALGCYLAVANGYQAAFMAPTEILATQHLQSLTPLFHALGMRVAVLLGSQTAKQKREVKAQMAAGHVDVVIGTHALVQEDVIFANLGLVVTDEQHRFGVGQRNALMRKGTQPHTIVMSATPIPRTLALMLYGDLDVSVIDQLPPNRKPIETYVVGEKMRDRVYAFVQKQVKAGGQVYVVCPLVEQGESQLTSAQEHMQKMQENCQHLRIGLLHGRMKGADKETVMQAFAVGDLDVLVSTTVIEVGVNVPNATLMVVEDGQQFGLSQLHQLRGRVGRGERQSYCICFGADKGDVAKARLKILASTTDGFEISKADLALRGSGDFLGTRQSGLPAVHMGDMAQDLQLMQHAQTEAQAIYEKDPQLQTYPILHKRVEHALHGEEGERVPLN